MEGSTVYVITNSDNGWDCLVDVLSSEDKVKNWFKINRSLEVTDIEDTEQTQPYVVFKKIVK